MIKRFLKIILVFVIAFSIFNVSKNTYASDMVEVNTVVKISSGGLKKVEPENNKKSTDINDDLGTLDDYKSDTGDIGKLGDKAAVAVGIIRTIGTVVSVIALISIGIKYMLGSVEERADYKKTLIPYLIGAIMVFTVSWLPQIIYDIVKEIE